MLRAAARRLHRSAPSRPRRSRHAYHLGGIHLSTVRSRWLKKYSVARGLEKQARKAHQARPTAKTLAHLKYRKARTAFALRVLKRHPPAASVPLRERAYQQATKLIGVMESGGNNVGREVEEIIREGGGVRGQAWCGWFNACCYKRAGSKSVTWRWGAVRLYLPGEGLSQTRTPKRGDIVRFTFDHTGMFVADRGDDIETIEGNTGASGAVSDSKTGGDGVYRKLRHKSLVRDYIRVAA